jgi:hypothetical protein
MDVLQERILPIDTGFLYNVFQLGDNPVRLVGTGSLASQDYPADIDMLSVIKTKYSPSRLYKDFEKVFSRIDNKNKLFFIEFKIQQKEDEKGDVEKHKIFKMYDLKPNLFDAYFNKNTELCKIDAIIWNEGRFKEVSCIYFFGNLEMDREKYIRTLLDDGKHYYEDGKIYKSLKRLMLSAKYSTPPDKNLIIVITRFFNSMVGKLYELDNVIQAGLIYMDKFGFDARMKMFIKNLGFGTLSPANLKKVSEQYQHLINSEAKRFYEFYNLPVGELPRYNSIKQRLQINKE